MRKRVRVVFARRLVVVALPCCLFFSCIGPDDGDGPQVVLYCSVDQTIAEPIIAAFERQSGIKVHARFDTEASKTVGLVQRLRAEAAAPLADVFWSSEVFHTIRLAGESLLEPYEGEGTQGWPVGLADRQHLWHGFALRGRVIAYHTGKIGADESPKTLEALLEDQWKERVVMAAPEFGTTGGDVASWFVHYGAERAREILEGLKSNGIRLVDGNSSAVRMVATGRADVCLTDTDDVYAAQRNDWPIAMNPLDQGGDGSLVIPNTAAMIEGGPHPEQAKALMAFLLSAQLEAMMARSDAHNAPIHAELQEEFADCAFGEPLAIDYVAVAEALPAAIQAAREILR